MSEGAAAATLMDMLLGGRLVSQAIACAAELRIADQLENGPRSADAIAEAIGAHGPSLRRLLRLLAAAGVVTETTSRAFVLTTMGACLRTRAEGSLAPAARWVGGAAHAAACDALAHAVRTGESGFRAAHGDEPFAWLARHPDEAALFHAAMTSLSASSAAAIVAAFDFSPFDTVVDVGGGHGHLLARVLAACPRARGVLFERAEIVDGARDALVADGLRDRCTVVAGDFFRAVPNDGDAYLLKNVLHDWPDDACVAILARCAGAMRPGGAVVVIEQLLGAARDPSFADVLDVEMLVMSDGGRERTEAEYAALFAAAGLRLARVVRTASPMRVLEARAQSSELADSGSGRS